jgi:TonB family protein
VEFQAPVLLRPPGFADACEPEDFLAALAHECAHIKRHDFRKNLIYEAAGLVAAFHPAIWFIKSRIAQTREMICDQMVAESLVAPREYAGALLRLAAMVSGSQPAATPAIGIFDANILEERIMAIEIRKHAIGRVLKSVLIAPAAILLFSTAVAAGAMAFAVEPSPAASTPPSQASPYGPVYIIGKGVSAPVPLKFPEAVFPQSERGSKTPINAAVVIRLIVDAAGMPHDARVVRSFKADFDAEAIKAVQRYRFKPALRAGQPVAVTLNVEVSFRKY